MNESKRISSMRKIMAEKKLDLCIIMEPDNQCYLSGFKAITYSRPLVLTLSSERIELILPGLEEKHAEAEAKVDKCHVYYEHPEQADKGISHIQHLNKILANYPEKSRVGIEFGIMTVSMYQYLQNKGYELLDIGQDIMEMRYVKDADEIELLLEAGKLSDLAVEGSLKSARVGISELELDTAGDRVLLEEVARSHPDTEVGYENWTASGIYRTVMPHLYSNSRVLQDGDMIIHSRQVWFKGYRAENERTFFVGKPGQKQMELFNLAVEAQQAGLDIIKPGIMAKEVDLAARKVFARGGYEDYANHRIGHGLGLSEHEEPYLRFDNELILQEGMVFSIEPGLYVPDIGGFRHSDTVIITANGAKPITEYPRELKDLIF